ncbi:unnamed protein product [Gongylonema pulchrum]|uniref:ZP domain-containing protein n=1 Tax=Gongylonema pulchrum TaxID=637853 RepID=A0A183E5Z7_9BILA|nr:unnamed protein product [Gongylonema pulchrum]
MAVAGIELPFDSCNVARSRSLNPRGIYVSAVVVITFHPQFITKVDRAYRIQCFYMEADKTVSTQIEVSDITTAFQTQVVPMPICRYEILEGGPTGSPIKYALIGQQVYHKWTCDSETVDTFCAVVHSCFVDDGNGDTVEILDESGCALDKYLLNNLEYPTEAHVYKYADRSELYYQCQISITVKEPNTDCPRPQCAEPQGFGAVKSAAAPAPAALALAPRNLRLIRKRSVDYDNTVDVRTEFSAVDISEEDPVLPADVRYRNRLPTTIRRPIILSYRQSHGTVCIAPHGILLIAFLGATFSVACVLFIIFVIYPKNSAKL